MLNDPQSITIDGVTTSLPLVNAQPTGRTYANEDGTLKLDVKQNQSKSRFRREFRLSQEKITSDPFTSDNKEVSTSIFIVVDEPKYGFSNTELGNLIEAVKTAYSSGAYNQILGGEM